MKSHVLITLAIVQSLDHFEDVYLILMLSKSLDVASVALLIKCRLLTNLTATS